MYFTKSKLTARSVPVLKLAEINVLFLLLGISVTKKSRISAENIGIKVSALPPS